MNEYPANQIALAKVVTGMKVPPDKKGSLKSAEQMMTKLRDAGFRIVPFPPLKAVAKAKAKAKTRQATKRKLAS